MSKIAQRKILLTNDDSGDSPLLPFVVEVLKERGDLTVVVPKEERSWSSKSITRYGTLHLEPISLDNGNAYSLDGTPSDCANLGIYHLFDDKPDLVVSGINLGLNAGLGAFLASGTVGACLEANIAGLPAVALSQKLSKTLFRDWAKHRRISGGELARFRDQIRSHLKQVFGYLYDVEGFWNRPVMWNVNLPDQPASDCRVILTSLAPKLYGSCFKGEGNRFTHEVDFFLECGQGDTDAEVVKRGHISVTRVDIRELGRSGGSA